MPRRGDPLRPKAQAILEGLPVGPAVHALPAAAFLDTVAVDFAFDHLLGKVHRHRDNPALRCIPRRMARMLALELGTVILAP